MRLFELEHGWYTTRLLCDLAESASHTAWQDGDCGGGNPAGGCRCARAPPARQARSPPRSRFPQLCQSINQRRYVRITYSRGTKRKAITHRDTPRNSMATVNFDGPVMPGSS